MQGFCILPQCWMTRTNRAGEHIGDVDNLPRWPKESQSCIPPMSLIEMGPDNQYHPGVLGGLLFSSDFCYINRYLAVCQKGSLILFTSVSKAASEGKNEV